MDTDWRNYPFRLVHNDSALDFPAAEGEHLQAQLEELAAAPLVVQAPQVVLSPVAPAV